MHVSFQGDLMTVVFQMKEKVKEYFRPESKSVLSLTGIWLALRD